MAKRDGMCYNSLTGSSLERVFRTDESTMKKWRKYYADRY